MRWRTIDGAKSSLHFKKTGVQAAFCALGNVTQRKPALKNIIALAPVP